jgi:hypothetical protein
MKNLILSALVISFVLVSCNQKNKESESTTAPMMEQDSTKTMKDGTAVAKDSATTDKVYACPMHPESTGKLNDKCPKCGMKLTVEVK